MAHIKGKISQVSQHREQRRKCPSSIAAKVAKELAVNESAKEIFNTTQIRTRQAATAR
jgi:hypothetical protein